MKKYKAVIFDLFDTVVNFNPSRLPSTLVNGVRVRSTSAAVYEVFKKVYKHVGFNEFHAPFVDSFVEFQKKKLEEHREFHNRERFKLMLNKMSIEDESDLEELLDEMVLAHMGEIAAAVDFPEENEIVLGSLKKDYRLALVSNFDYAPTAYAILEKFNIKRFFEKVVISMEVGWRKPKSEIFHKCLNLLGIKPEDAIFVGDNFDADVIGAKTVGMDVIWINKNNEPHKERDVKPDYTVSKLSEIKEILKPRADFS